MSNPYTYIEESADILSAEYLTNLCTSPVKPIVWAQKGRYGFISKEQVLNMMHRLKDLAEQQKGYAKDKPLDLFFHSSDTLQIDPVAVELMRGTSQ